MKFLLDTNTVSFAIRGVGGVKERLLEHRPSEIGVSSITAAELQFGAFKRGSKRLHRLIDTFLDSVEEAPFDFAAASAYGRIEAALQAKGEPIGMADAMIGAHALTLDVILVTNNLRHFRRIEDLEIVDWVDPSPA